MRTNMHPEDIKAAVRRTGITLAEVGRRAGVKRNTLYKALKVPCPKGQRAIADYLGRSLNDIWPEWYDRNGRRTLAGRETSSAGPVRHRQRKAAA